MASITLTIPDAQLLRIINALCAKGIGIPPTPVEATAPNAKLVLVDWIKQTVSDYELTIARNTVAIPNVASIVS